ncbi:MAG: hypothetical protein RDV48_24605 [Candidatus Eremiobacteraeota bacterium]|nr:hypothetical protein [Candidatus Eremiobacteraeota bacterium]
MNLISQSSVMSMAQMQLTDSLLSEKTAMQMAALKTKSTWESWKLNQDLQTEIYKIQQEVTLHRAKTQDKMINKWDEYIKG